MYKKAARNGGSALPLDAVLSGDRRCSGALMGAQVERFFQWIYVKARISLFF